MKKQSLLLLAVLVSFTAVAQNVGIGTTTPNSSSMLEIKSNSKGLLIPRTSTTSRTAIVNPAKGLTVYDTTTGSFWFHNGSAWTQIETSGKNWSLTGNAGTNPATNFIGTTDAQPLLFRVNDLPAGLIHPTNDNTAFGLNTLTANTTGNSNTANGTYALYSNNTGYYNTANGVGALYSNTGGYNNTANGVQALFYNTTGYLNTANGVDALHSNTAGNSNTANGNFALSSNNTGNENTANGEEALFSNTTASSNTANGYQALYSNTIGHHNTANGNEALYSNSQGIYNTATGDGALYDNTTGNDNTATGDGALYHNTTGSSNTANGYFALLANTGGYANTANGNAALYSNTAGYGNTADGASALYYNTAGYYNTAIGAGAGCIPGTTPSNFTALGYNAGMVGSGSNTVEIGNTSVTWIGGQVGWSTYSDGRIKDNIVANVPGLAFISRLRPVTYNLNIHRQNLLCGIADTVQWEGRHDIEKITQTGFVAQEVEQAATESNYNFNGVQKPKNEHGLYSLNYSSFVVPLVKAVQEQQQQIEALKDQNAELIKRIEALEKK